MQFLRENGLVDTLKTLNQESGVTMNSLQDPAPLIDSIRQGKWDSVLGILSTIVLPPTALFDLHELLIVELVVQGDMDTARLVFRGSVCQTLRNQNERRYLKLENFISQASLGGSLGVESYFGVAAEERRGRVAQKVMQELRIAPNGRLLTLLGQAIQMQIQGDIVPADSVYDIFHGIVPEGSISAETVDVPITKCFKRRTLAAGAHVESAAFSANGAWLAVGLADGFIEILNPITGQRRLDLTYQQNESSMMVMEHAVIALSFNHDGSVLAVGTHGGEAAVWRTDTGSCISRFNLLHKDGVSVIKLARDGQTLLTAGYDGAIRLTGLKSGRIVKEFSSQHDSFVTDVAFNRDETLLYSCGADGKLNIFDMRRSSCIDTVLPFSTDRLSHGAIQKLIPCSATDNLIVCSRSGRALVVGPDGKTRQEFISKHNDVVTAAASPHQRYLYLVHEKGFISCIDTGSAIVTEIECTGENIGCVSHPLYNQLVSFSVDGSLRLWKPL
ncbi:hypothetical protein PSACC_02149 [Paramicrosporidium saccamoebae]|uniref:CTLH domain-containing protein n=1 Tax=Paramicrosporidium saccamoebae TaxID=1246581 RepID=A0A2H9TJT5_9FUNG|nr:hypothetical protein PSACC_02149 [Paramicrosporidium saccamoebae]